MSHFPCLKRKIDTLKSKPLSNKYEKLLESVSRTFALSINYLPTKVKDAITLSYMLLRVSDILEDNYEESKEEKVRLLHLWVEIMKERRSAKEMIDAIQDLDKTDPEVIVALRADELLEYLATFPEEIQDIIVKHVCDTTIGMARWQVDGPIINTVKEMDDYMHEVAGRVGYLITEVFAWHSPKIFSIKDKLMPLSREFGLALQTVNIIQGMKKDYERGWIFTPKEFLDKAGISVEDFFNVKNEEKALEVIDMLVQKAERHLRLGLDFVTEIPKKNLKIRLACMWPLFFAVKTLVLSNKNLELLTKEVKITRQQVSEVLSLTTLKGISNTWTKNYYNKLVKEGNLS